MSDYGTMIIIRRRDGEPASGPDRAAVESAAALVRGSDEPRSALGAPFLFRVGEARLDTGVRGLSLLLSEYWLAEEGDGDAEDAFAPDVVLAGDRDAAATVLERLRGRLHRTYELELVADHW